MKCCANCFGDDFLESVIKHQSQEIGNCSFCNTTNMNIVEPKELNNYFQILFNIYEEVEEGISLAKLLKNDWMLFPELIDDKVTELLEMIIDTKIEQNYSSISTKDETKILNWRDFTDELKYDNRYFPLKAPTQEDLKQLLKYVEVSNENIPVLLYRARVNEDDKLFEIKDMGKPPYRLATAGRANPVGIPYLYTASTIDTAIAEIRPHKSDSLTVATLKVNESLKLADLRNPKQTISPFMQDEDGVKEIYTDLEYLKHLGNELSKPILPKKASLEYLSSQYLCEFIKHCGFDGVIYKSSVGSGDNYAIFFEDKLEILDTQLYNVNDVNIVANKIDQQ
jgi:hypothetical protein